ncbi:hypothetical protein K504DRAFT_501824 [Pleomassaria siparia CBS 279.74]|uniref:Uncharacterized protein n=1 Tax=Pleomassaria siparia CBS 279.74 TaxID=1314801 RepID=A0A6G1KCG9_9PLEO|nr:hypothetical protein K504DRAFT_501824 [Pleomassaria siparia CBS 279.74]
MSSTQILLVCSCLLLSALVNAHSSHMRTLVGHAKANAADADTDVDEKILSSAASKKKQREDARLRTWQPSVGQLNSFHMMVYMTLSCFGESMWVLVPYVNILQIPWKQNRKYNVKKPA